MMDMELPIASPSWASNLPEMGIKVVLRPRFIQDFFVLAVRQVR
jgi:hypothetical protein